MSNELLTMSKQSALDLSRIHNAALLKESQSLDALVSQLRSGAVSLMESAEQVRREQAIILDRIQSTKLYEKDGFKSLAEYGETIGLGKSTTYALARVGKVYNDKKAPAQLKAMSPSNLDALSSALRANPDQVFKDAEKGSLDGMSQDNLREYVKTIATPVKAKVVKTYQAFTADGEPVPGDGTSANADYTMDEWKAWYSNVEFHKIPNDKDGNTRFCMIDDHYVDVVTLKEYKPKANDPVKTITGAPSANFITAKLKAAGKSDEEIAAMLTMLGMDN